MHTDFGNAIFTLRKQKGLTQGDLSALLHISTQAVSKWERNQSLPDTMLLPKIAAALGCSIDTLFGYSSK